MRLDKRTLDLEPVPDKTIYEYVRGELWVQYVMEPTNLNVVESDTWYQSPIQLFTVNHRGYCPY
jgi:hypothetical protein